MATFACDVPGCEFTSSGWDNDEQAAARGVQHQNEHDTGELMQSLEEFRQQVGFVGSGE